MKLVWSCIWLAVLITGIEWSMSCAVRAEDPSSPWKGIQRLQVDLTSHDTTPFLQWDVPDISGAAPDQPQPEVPLSKTSHQATASASANRHINSPVNGQTGPSHPDAQKSELKASLAHEGQASLERRDSLTQEALGVMKWTVVTLIVGFITVVAIKKAPFQNMKEESGHRIRVLETRSLGRQQALKLVEVGGERFLVASDQGGIKSVNMLPSWPALEEIALPELKIHPFPEIHEDKQSSHPVAA